MTFTGTSRETLTDEQLDMSEPDADPHRWSGSPARRSTLTIGAAILKTSSRGDLIPLILRTTVMLLAETTYPHQMACSFVRVPGWSAHAVCETPPYSPSGRQYCVAEQVKDDRIHEGGLKKDYATLSRRTSYIRSLN